jgi:WD40 repeat protein
MHVSPTLIVASGSYFSKISIWKPFKSNQIERILEGHNGCILSIRFLNENEIISSSDDRTVRTWKFQTSSSFNISSLQEGLIDKNHIIQTKEEEINQISQDKQIEGVVVCIEKPLLTLYGHTGRVWNCQYFYYEKNLFIITTGEDLKLIIWDYLSGRSFTKLEGIIIFHLTQIIKLFR